MHTQIDTYNIDMYIYTYDSSSSPTQHLFSKSTHLWLDEGGYCAVLARKARRENTKLDLIREPTTINHQSDSHSTPPPQLDHRRHNQNPKIEVERQR